MDIVDINGHIVDINGHTMDIIIFNVIFNERGVELFRENFSERKNPHSLARNNGHNGHDICVHWGKFIIF